MDIENKDIETREEPYDEQFEETDENLTEEEYIKAQAYSDRIRDIAEEGSASINWLKEFYEWTQSIAVAVVLALLINQFLFSIVQVEGSSMVPTLHDQERLIVVKPFYTPKNGDIVIVKSSVLGKYIVKRVIATPGQELNINGQTGDVSIDGTVREESYIKEKLRSAGTKYKFPITIPENTVFVMGDNRNNSQDSRAIGLVPYSEVMGKAVFRILPFSKFGGLYHDMK